MTLSPPGALLAVRGRLRDDSLARPVLDDEDVDRAIQTAVVSEYSRHRPRLVVHDETSGGSYFDVSDWAGWVDGFSEVQQVEYPAIDPTAASTGDPPILEPRRRYDMYTTPTVNYLRLIGLNTAATETLRITFTTPRAYLSGGAQTIESRDLEAVLDLSASIACLTAASRAVPIHDGMIRAQVDRGGESDKWISMHEHWRKRYLLHMGLPTGDGTGPETRPAGIVIDVDNDASHWGRWLTHEYPRRTHRR